jgi:polyphosphate kinase
MKNERKHYTPAEKVAILKRHLLEKVPISQLSPIVSALMEAAQSKEVTVVVELKARFDEASNIRWARSLEEAGVQVFHGLVGLKTHCKLALLARHDEDGEVRQYAHLGTGNYNPSTARFYSDLSLLTCSPKMTSAVHSVFNFLTARSEEPDYKPAFCFHPWIWPIIASSSSIARPATPAAGTLPASSRR